MSEAAVIEKNTELSAELSKRRRELNEQQKSQDEQECKLKKRRLIGRIFMAVMVILIVVMLIAKYMIYFRPENVKIAGNSKSISSVNPDTSGLQVMPFNTDLTVAFQPILICDSRDKSVQIDFISPDSTKVLVRAEIFTSKENLGNKKLKMFWHDKVYPDDESLVRIGATGWLRPGEMIEKLTLDELPTRMGDVTVRFTAVNPANYSISGGVFDMNTVLHIVDYKGNMLNENGEWVKAE